MQVAVAAQAADLAIETMYMTSVAWHVAGAAMGFLAYGTPMPTGEFTYNWELRPAPVCPNALLPQQ